MDGILKLKEYRKKLNMSQRDVAKMIKITQASYCRWERGLNFPSGKQILELCDIFRCTPNDLFGVRGIVKTMYEDKA